jgi:uncharacterized protein YjbI with pentapeptide repeats
MRRPIQESPFVKRRREQLNAPKPQEPIKKGRIHRVVDWIDNWHVTRLFQAIGSFLLVLTIVGFYFDYEDRKQGRIVDAWQLITTKAPGNSGKKEALEYLNSIRQPLTGIDLSTNKENGESGVYLERANLSRAFFGQAKLDNANLSFTNLERALLNSANLNEANLMGTNLTSANLIRANLINANLLNAQLNNVDLANANLEGAYLLSANLTNANLISANLMNADLLDADLTDADLTDADLTNADLTGTIGLTCKQLTQAKNWQLSYRDEELACGADTTIKPPK